MSVWEDTKNSISESVQEMIMAEIKAFIKPENVKQFLATYADKARAEMVLMKAQADLANAKAEQIRSSVKARSNNPPITMNDKMIRAKTGT